ncbi:hypothetical protein B0H13DRAFT_1649320 [Mycena leptocephala]|nr:hypothetical protein B0H13DRAFT_1649320 [Mycena leptocephala]
MGNIPTPWPSPEILETLVRNSSGYFIYASTVIKFIDDEYSRPSTQLDIVLAPHDTASPFEALDQLYLQILLRAPAHHRSTLCDILSVIVNYPRYTPITVEEIDDLLGLDTGTVSLILRPLHSVLKIMKEVLHSIEVHHAAFCDFLITQERSSIFCVGSPQHRAKLACSILKALVYTYQDPRQYRANIFSRWCVRTGTTDLFLILLCRANVVPESGLTMSLPKNLPWISCPLFDWSIRISSSGTSFWTTK